MKCNHIFGYWNSGEDTIVYDQTLFENLSEFNDMLAAGDDGVVVFNYCPICGGSYADPDEKQLNDLFDDLEGLAANNPKEYAYEIKQANQLIRKHFEKIYISKRGNHGEK